MAADGSIPVTDARKYDILDLGTDYGRYTLQLIFDNGIMPYVFTFGS